MKKYVVQCKYPDGDVGLSVNTAKQIIDMAGFSDCSCCEYEVYGADVFGKLVKLERVAPDGAPYNRQMFRNPETGELEIDGYSPEH